MSAVEPDPDCVACHGCGTQDEMDEIEGGVRPCPWCWTYSADRCDDLAGDEGRRGMTANAAARRERDYRRLQDAQHRVEQHAQEREARDDLVRAVVADGWTHAAVAEATGLTRGRVNQIARGKR